MVPSPVRPRAIGLSKAVRFAAAAAVAAIVILAAAPPGRRAVPAAGAALGFSGPAAIAAADVGLVPLASGLPSITSIVHAGDSRLFLTEQTGRIVIWDGTRILPVPFLDLSGSVSCCGERGLLSAAFHPRYAANGFFFVNYTNPAGNTVVARYRVSVADPDSADAASGVVLLTIAQPFANHNGGELQFGPDGYLYIGMGDGGSANDPMCNAQRDDSLLGKLLRIDVDRNVSSPPFHGIPPDNPFRDSGGAVNEVWDKGLRNPWRFTFDRVTGDLWIGDVGQDSREEIDFEPRGSAGGRNYGWKVMEATACGAGGTSGCPSPALIPPCGSPLYTAPVLEYTHDTGECSVTGGYLYRGAAMPDFLGAYFFGDYCSGRIRAGGRIVTARAAGLTTFGEDAAGELFAATDGGAFYRLVETGAPPTATSTATPAMTPTTTATSSPEPRAPLIRVTAKPTPRVIRRS